MGELTALPQAPWLYLKGPTLRGWRGKREGREGKGKRRGKKGEGPAPLPNTLT